MDLGNKILELRKRNNLSQEELAEKLNVTRQTISKWELEETTPDIKQAKELSKIFNISLDELTSNDVKNILVEKVSNTEKLAGIVIKILKAFGIFIIVWLVLCTVAFICFTVFKKEPSNSSLKSATMNCLINDNEYSISIGSDGYFECVNCDKKMRVYLMDITDWANIEHGIENIHTYFKNNGGTCE